MWRIVLKISILKLQTLLKHDFGSLLRKDGI